ncbi:hypothetical protein [Promicromonospora iranensis]|uniref:Uncharacterized protein n=1 Tax=Promicromonospora iranensis TaxID=1105144 RepID=A0ABU2CV61_9MICO|nr:hypothetical protein [Promicromonospora iranensis]MDR7385226.1 hypothetical protein [Promicromonospora iranensis]
MSTDITWASTWKCPDCGTTKPIAPGENTKPISDAHECDSTTLAIHQAGLAGWVDGYRFALEHLDEPMVVADRAEFGTGWAGMVGAGAVVIESEEPS